ncbi:coniferyl aldehyde dehydrogenase [Cognatiluteimonas weifangensis]|uniref:Aldehyde dehydrogenase n=1 Tax=Cognatiluteimonas weifangensis TaxID=2303539 RepID=A0A372DHD0_9GAMM|nr:coniferyl aldehyde dehydrogenase [Luteimonas weifangensis]RFP58936.1 coniferyl aldehyde dehydrogenase [Luteimonas weifangensis]
MDATTPADELQPTLQRLHAAWQARRPDLAQRRADLQRLRAAFAAGTEAMDAAIRADFGHRSTHENLISEAMIVKAELGHALRHLRRWTRPRRIAVGWRFWPARAQVRPQPLGVVGIIAPWNYPVNLALVPLVSAIAAGNHVYLKPSEHTPRTALWLRELLAQVFPPERVAVALGGPELGAAFAALPFDHLLFTGSTAVGRKVLAAAAPNLTPVTLELGGKAPAILAPDFPLPAAAARIAGGKWFNAGQTCIGVDYALVDAARRDAFVAELRDEVAARYGDLANADDYTRIVNDGQYARLRGYLDDARARGCEVVELIALEPARAQRERLFAPTLVLDPPDDALVMREEIFGPILPVRSYRTLEEALALVKAGARPLALYAFSRDRATVERILEQTSSGGVTVNDTLLHFGVHELPFGGIGPSGMGAIHGKAGFDTFSKQLPVFRQSRFAASDWIKPPYRGRVDKLIRALAR